MVFCSKLSVSTWLASFLYSLHPEKTVHQYCHYCLFYIFFFSTFQGTFLPMFSNSSFVIQSFFLIIFAWSHKHCSAMSVSWHSFHIICTFCPISSHWFTLFVDRPTQEITFHYSCIQCLCPCSSFLIVIINIDIILSDDLHGNPLKLVTSTIFPNKSFHSSSPKTTTLPLLSTFKGVLFIVASL